MDGTRRIVIAAVGVCTLLMGSWLVGACSPERATPSRTNELPFGAVDIPKNGEVVGRTLDVLGWAADDSGIAVVHVYVDGKFNAAAHLTITRPDVSKAFPKYTRHDPALANVHGWQTVVDLGEKPGPHTILAQAVDDEGATRDLGSVVVTLVGRQ
jgi:hypothetical protein